MSDGKLRSTDVKKEPAGYRYAAQVAGKRGRKSLNRGKWWGENECFTSQPFPRDVSMPDDKEDLEEELREETAMFKRHDPFAIDGRVFKVRKVLVAVVSKKTPRLWAARLLSDKRYWFGEDGEDVKGFDLSCVFISSEREDVLDFIEYTRASVSHYELVPFFVIEEPE